MASNDDANRYCHITGGTGTLCNATGADIVYFGSDDAYLKVMQRHGSKKCGKCNRPRCQECIRLWEGLQRSALLETIIPR